MSTIGYTGYTIKKLYHSWDNTRIRPEINCNIIVSSTIDAALDSPIYLENPTSNLIGLIVNLANDSNFDNKVSVTEKDSNTERVFIFKRQSSHQLMWTGTYWKNMTAIGVDDVYVRWPGRPAPEDIYPLTKWADITQAFHGAFFRAYDAEKSAAFETSWSQLVNDSSVNVQADQLPLPTGEIIFRSKEGSKTHFNIETSGAFTTVKDTTSTSFVKTSTFINDADSVLASAAAQLTVDGAYLQFTYNGVMYKILTENTDSTPKMRFGKKDDLDISTENAAFTWTDITVNGATVSGTATAGTGEFAYSGFTSFELTSISSLGNAKIVLSTSPELSCTSSITGYAATKGGDIADVDQPVGFKYTASETATAPFKSGGKVIPSNLSVMFYTRTY